MRPAVPLAASLSLFALTAALAACGQRIAIGGSDPADAGEPPPPPDPCAAHVCGEPCAIPGCPGAETCGAPDLAGYCDLAGHCVAAFPACSPGCEGRQCGEPCGCPPDAPDCPAAFCDGLGRCIAGAAPPCPCVPEQCPPLPGACTDFTCGVACNPCEGIPGCQPPPPGAFVCTGLGPDGQSACVLAESVTCTSSPCAGAPCGALCDPCGGDPTCPSPPPGAFVCDGAGTCVPVDAIGCPSPPPPCGDKLCGATCDPCAGDPGCEPPPPPDTFRCDETGACVPGSMVTCPTGYAPCASKACGDPCSICEPGFPCDEPPEPFACDPFGNCMPGLAPCP